IPGTTFCSGCIFNAVLLCGYRLCVRFVHRCHMANCHSFVKSVYSHLSLLSGIPYWYERSPTVLYIALIIGHWLLINVSWNYYKALWTPPGFPSEVCPSDIVYSIEGSFCERIWLFNLQRQLITQVVTFCK